jgi:arylsulfatase A-like enzyme
VHHVDVLPTLLELAGLPVPEGARGVALGPVARGAARLPERLVFTDIGVELSAYAPEGFVRVAGVEGAWDEGRAASRALAPISERYAWQPDGSWTRVDASPLPSAQIAAYYRDAVPMRLIGAPSEDDRERLRALGYLDPDDG